jgi:hypothetical protein
MSEALPLANITVERLEKAMDLARGGDPQEAFNAMLNLEDDIKVFFITRGMMYACLELEFGIEGHDMWDAVSYYTEQINKGADETGEGFDYFK